MIHLKKNFKIKSLKKKNLSNTLKKKIFKLKMEHYKFNFKSQTIWFNQNIGDQDIHNLLFYKNQLIGYNCLRKIFFNEKNKKYFFLFDTLLIKKKFKNFGFSNKILYKSNKLIKKEKTFGLLFCKKNMLNYYKKFDWIKIKSSLIRSSRLKKLECMQFNLRNKISRITF